LGYVLNSKFEGLLILFKHFQDFDEQVYLLAFIWCNLGNFLQRCVVRFVDYRVAAEIVNCPSTKVVKDRLFKAKVLRVALARELVWLV
jgi:hypothetical protein